MNMLLILVVVLVLVVVVGLSLRKKLKGKSVVVDSLVDKADVLVKDGNKKLDEIKK